MAASLAPTFNGWGDMSNYAAEQAAQLGQSVAPTIKAATLSPYTATGNVNLGNVANMTAQGVLGDQRQFADPYNNAVIGTSLSNYDNQARQTLAQMAAQAARNGAFSGSRYGVREGQTIADSLLGRATLEANLRSQGWNTAMGNALSMGTQNQNTDLGRAVAQGNISAQLAMSNAANANQASMNQAQLQQQASLANAQMQQQQQQQNLAALGLIGNTAVQMQQGVQSDNAGDRADLSLLADIGAQQQALDQQAANAQLTQLANAGNLMGAVPTQAYTGQTVDMTGNSTTTQNGGLMGAILGGLSLIPGL